MNETGPEHEPSAEDHRYFTTIERSFLALRQKATLLTAADWQEAQNWHRQGVPVELVQDVMEKLFERQRAKKGRTISGLRYFRAAVEAAWEELVSLRAGGRAEEAQPLPVGVRLKNLSTALPNELPERENWVERLAALALAGGAPSVVEEELATLDQELLSRLAKALTAEEREAVEAQVAAALARLRGRLDADELDLASRRVSAQLLRRRFAAPVLSLFSPEARGEAEGAELQER